MAGHVIHVPQDDGEIVVTVPGVRRVPLPVVDGRVTVHDDEVEQAVLTSIDGAVLVEGSQVDYDPAEQTVDEVNTHLDKHPEQADAVLAAEAEGRARKGILEGRHATEQAEAEPAQIAPEPEAETRP
jgi:hypothetical protein